MAQRGLHLSFVQFHRAFAGAVATAGVIFATYPSTAGADATSTPAMDVVEMKSSVHAYWKPRRHWRYDRGTVLRKSRFRVLDRAQGKGCKGDWLRIDKLAWICSRDTKPTTEQPGGRVLPTVKKGRVLPFRYVVTKDAPVYKTLDDAVAEQPAETLVGVGGYTYRGTRVRDGKRYFRINKGWVPKSHARRAKAPKFKGIALTPADVNKRHGFIRVAWARLYKRDGKRARKVFRRLKYVELLDPVRVGKRVLFPLKSNPELHVRADHVGLIDIAKPPAEVGANENWIDVNMAEQVLVAYQGKHPVLATLVSTARTVTPTGVFRIERKRAFAIMKSKPHYTTHWNVHTPWVISIKGRIAMHGVYWHNEFGTARSHGCVNLAPMDAKWVWDWTEPALPPGWSRIKATKGAPGSVVRIRRQKVL